LLCTSVRDFAEREGRGDGDDEVREVDESVFHGCLPLSPLRFDGLFPRCEDRGDSRLSRFEEKCRVKVKNPPYPT
jgi:hypothetical protein